ncbi:MAG: hypothetical protein HYX84_00750 [Chloroflexi bacterium]|nr:hypothetical protein [Chloroflexota bacterium]
MSADLDKIIKWAYFDYGVGGFLSEEEFARFVNESYDVIVQSAKKGSPIFYGQLPCFDLLRGRFGDGVRKVIGMVVGACSEYDVANGRPPISAIVVTQDTAQPGEGFYGLSTIADDLSTRRWESRGRKPSPSVIRESAIFWLEQVQKVFECWKGK